MPTKLETFLTEKKIDRRQVLIVSKHLEGLKPEDRAIRLAKRLGSKAEDKDKKEKETRKPRSGKPITSVTLSKIFAGKAVPGPTRTRVLRAVNVILERKKHEKVDLGTLFDLSEKTARVKKPVKVEKKKR